MKINAKKLLQVLSIANRVSGKSITEPIIDGFLFEVIDNVLYVTKTDLKTTIVVNIPVESYDLKAVIPSNELISILNMIEEVELIFKENSLTIKSETGLFKIPLRNPSKFPETRFLQGNHTKIDSSLLDDIISRTSKFMSKDDLRPNMSCVLMRFNNNNVVSVATDAHKMSVHDLQGNFDPREILVDRACISVITGVFSGEVNIYDDADSIMFENDGKIVITKKMANTYPNFQAVIPQNNKTKITIDRKYLINSLKRMSIFSNKINNGVLFNIKNNELYVLSENEDKKNSGYEKLKCEISGEDNKIAFNSSLIIETISSTDAEVIDLLIESEQRACVIKEEDKPQSLFLVMPIRIN